jgi:hypothetical protein
MSEDSLLERVTAAAEERHLSQDFREKTRVASSRYGDIANTGATPIRTASFPACHKVG